MVRKGKMATHKGDMKEALSGTHLDVTCETLDDLNEDDLMKSLQAAAGAHKPNGYEFEDGVFMEADFYGLGIGEQCKGESSEGVGAAAAPKAAPEKAAPEKAAPEKAA